MFGKIKVVEQYDGFKAYDCGGIYYIQLKKGAIASDHIHNSEEIIYLVEGKAEYTVGNKTQLVEAPTKIVIPPKTYHKFVALTNCVGIEKIQKN